MLKIRASNLERVSLCPGSARATDGVKSLDSPEARRGTQLHAIMAALLIDNPKKPMDPNELNDALNVCPDTSRSDGELIQQAHRDFMTNKGEGAIVLEQTIPLDFLGMTEGRADLIQIDPGKGQAMIVDWKFGTSYVTEARDNLQLAAYAAGLAKGEKAIRTAIEVCIIQPGTFAQDKRVNSFVYDMPTLNQAVVKIKEIIAKANAEDAPLVAGDLQCKFCPVKSTCSAYALFAGKLGQAQDKAKKIALATVTEGEAVVVTSPLPIQSPVVVIGGAIVAKARDLLARIKTFKATDQFSANALGEMSKEARQMAKLIDDNRKQLKEPSLNFGRAIDTAAKAASDPLEEAALHADRQVTDYFREQERKEAEARRKIEESAKKAREELEKAVKLKDGGKAQAARHEEAERQIEIAKEQEHKLDELATQSRVTGYRNKEEMTFEIPDFSKIPPEFLSVVLIKNDKVINAMIKSGALNEAKHSAWLQIKRETVAGRSR